MPRLLKLLQCQSTNSYLWEMLKIDPLEDGLAVVCREQLQGRGQRGNSWEAEAGKNLTMSLLFLPTQLEAKHFFVVSQWVSLALCQLLDQLGLTDICIKWPNDIYQGDHKIAGILIENQLIGHHLHRSVVGIGLNVNQQQFLSDAPNPISIVHCLQRELELDKLARQLHSMLWEYYEHYSRPEQFASLQALYWNRLYRREGFHLFRDQKGAFMARLSSVSPNGLLCLEDPKGQLRQYAFKEVSFVTHTH